MDGQHHRPAARHPVAGRWWPGRAYVTWVGIDGYYLKPSWAFAPLFGPTIKAIRTLTLDPILISETGGRPGGRQAGQDRRPVRRRPRLRAARAWSGSTSDKHRDWRLDGPAAIAAFRRGAQPHRGLAGTSESVTAAARRAAAAAAPAAAAARRSVATPRGDRRSWPRSRRPAVVVAAGAVAAVAGAAEPPARAYLGVFAPPAPASYAGVQRVHGGHRGPARPGRRTTAPGTSRSRPASRATAARHHAVPLVQIDPTDSAWPRSPPAATTPTCAPTPPRCGPPAAAWSCRFGHEMNGNWYSWGYQHALTAAVFVAAWRHIVTVFRPQGAGNVTWLWTVNVIEQTSGDPVAGRVVAGPLVRELGRDRRLLPTAVAGSSRRCSGRRSRRSGR